MPDVREHVDNGGLAGVVHQVRHVPEPYDTEMNYTLRGLRRRLFDLIDVSTMTPEQKATAKRAVKDATKDAWNSLRRMVLEILPPE